MASRRKTVAPQNEAAEGRSSNLDGLAIHPEQVMAETGPQDWRDPRRVFARIRFGRALQEHAGMMPGQVPFSMASSTPIVTLMTQLGGAENPELGVLYLSRGRERRPSKGMVLAVQR
jgi:hypothetical protein